MRRIIDFHQHLVLAPHQIKTILDEYNIEKAIVMPFDFGSMDWNKALKVAGMNAKDEQYIKEVLKKLPQINDNLYKIVEKDSRLMFTPWISTIPKDPLEKLNNKKWKVAKIIPIFDYVVNEKTYVKQISPIIEQLVDMDKIVMIHSGWGARPSLFAKVFRRFPTGRFVVAHMKEDIDTYNIERKKLLSFATNNIWIETSYAAGPHRIKQYVDKGWGNRLLFGSDFRNESYIPTLEWFIQMIELSDISEKSKANIFYDNAKFLLG